jgi:hypothetical protein
VRVAEVLEQKSRARGTDVFDHVQRDERLARVHPKLKNVKGLLASAE